MEPKNSFAVTYPEQHVEQHVPVMNSHEFLQIGPKKLLQVASHDLHARNRKIFIHGI